MPLQGVQELPKGYHRRHPLPRIPSPRDTEAGAEEGPWVPYAEGETVLEAGDRRSLQGQATSPPCPALLFPPSCTRGASACPSPPLGLSHSLLPSAHSRVETCDQPPPWPPQLPEGDPHPRAPSCQHPGQQKRRRRRRKGEKKGGKKRKSRYVPALGEWMVVWRRCQCL